MKKRVITLTFLRPKRLPIGEEVRIGFLDGKPFVGYVTSKRGNVVEVTEA